MGMAVVSDHSQFTERLDGITKLFMAIAAISLGEVDDSREIQAGKLPRLEVTIAGELALQLHP